MTPQMIRSMASNPIVFALANPVPEIMPDLARETGASIVATGRSDFPNQINNVLAFPGIFRGALDVRSRDINEAMKLAATAALAYAVDENSLSPDYILPRAFESGIAKRFAIEVARAAVTSGSASLQTSLEELEEIIDRGFQSLS